MFAFTILTISATLGWLAIHFRLVRREFSVQLNRFIIYVSLPALTLLNVHDLKFSKESWLAVSMPWLLFLICTLVILLLATPLKFSRRTTGALILTAGLGNTSFIGFPLVSAYYGDVGLQTAVLIDQPGTFLILAMVGVPVAIRFSGGERLSTTALIKRVVSFPPFIALLVALMLRPFEIPENFKTLLSWIGMTLAPLAMGSVAIQTYGSIHGWRSEATALMAGLLLKLAAMPFLIWLIYIYGFGAKALPAHVIVFEASMAPMITASLVASERGLNPRLCGLMLAIGIPLSLLTSAVWYQLLNFLVTR